MKSFIFSFALLLAFAIPSYSEWNYKLLWERKSYESQFNSQGFRGSRFSPNDSSILTLSWDFETSNRNSFFKFNAFTGEVIKYYPNEDSISSFSYSKDGSYLAVCGNNFLGFADTANLKYTFKINSPGTSSYFYNEEKNVIIGFNNNNIRLFNSQNGELIKEYQPSYFTPSDLVINNVALSNVDNKLIYDYRYAVFVGPQPDKYKSFNILKIIDINGKIIYEDNTINLISGKSPWALSNDGTKIAYYNNNIKIIIFDLVTMKVISEVDAVSPAPVSLKFSKDDKILYHSYFDVQGLFYFDLIYLKTYKALPYGTYDYYYFDQKSSKLLINGGNYLDMLEISLKSNVNNNSPVNLFTIIRNPIQDSIEMKFNLINSYLLNASLYDLNGKMTSQLENKIFEAGNYDLIYNINNLPNGTYFIQIKLNGENYPQVIKFVKGGK